MNHTVSYSAIVDLLECYNKLQFVEEADADFVKTIEHSASQTIGLKDRIKEQDFLKLWNIIEKYDEKGVGLRIGRTINPEAKGLLASWVSHAKTLREALEIFRENIALMNASENWHLRESGEKVELELIIKSPNIYPNVAIERSMSAMVTWARALSGLHFYPSKAYFKFEHPENLEHLEQYSPIFGKHLVFNAKRNMLIFDTGLLDAKNLSYNPLVKELIANEASQAQLSLQRSLTTKEKLYKLFQQSLERESAFNMTLACEKLGVSRQTLYRQLKAEQTDFQSELDTFKRDETIKRLKNNEKVKSISLVLGYHDLSSFYKAFRRWFNCSPKEYLENALESPKRLAPNENNKIN